MNNLMRNRCGSVCLGTLGLSVVLGALGGCPSQDPTLPAPDTPIRYSGQATVVSATVSGQATRLVEAGPLPVEGGNAEASLLLVDVANLLTAEVAHAATVARNGVVQSESSLADIQLNVAGHSISADFLVARAVASCSNGTPTVRGVFEVANLLIDGQPVNASADPNQQTPLFDLTGAQVGRVTINQQIQSSDGAHTEMTVNGIRVEVFNVADVVLFQARAGITCGSITPAVGDFITGGGRITATPSGGVAAFGVAGGSIFDGFWGHLNYLDNAADLHVRSTGITAYTLVDATTRRIEGTAEINGAGGATFIVELSDKGEPGTADTFSIQLSNGYTAGGKLAGGSVQLHAEGG